MLVCLIIGVIWTLIGAVIWVQYTHWGEPFVDESESFIVHLTCLPVMIFNGMLLPIINTICALFHRG